MEKFAVLPIPSPFPELFSKNQSEGKKRGAKERGVSATGENRTWVRPNTQKLERRKKTKEVEREEKEK
jgi:hypothetical protein